MEKIPNDKERTDIIAHAIRTFGFENPDARKLLDEWIIGQEQYVESVGTREAQLDFEIGRAELYFNAGLKEQALEALEDAGYIALEENMSDYRKLIFEKSQEFSKS